MENKILSPQTDTENKPRGNYVQKCGEK